MHIDVRAASTNKPPNPTHGTKCLLKNRGPGQNIIQPTPLKGLHLEDREFQQSYITFKNQVHRPYDRETSNGGSSERRSSTNLHTAPRPFHVTQERGRRSISAHVRMHPSPGGGALDRAYTYACSERRRITSM
jgi:hypothetical protein